MAHPTPESCDQTRRSLSYRTSLECLLKTILDGRFPDVSNTLFCLLYMQGPHVLDQTFSPFCQSLRKLFFWALAWLKECTQSNSKLLRNETLGGMTPEDWNKAGAPCAQHAHVRHWGLAITDKIYTRTCLELRDAIAGLPEKTTGATRK